MPRTGLSAAEMKEKAIDLTIEQMREFGFEKVRLVEIARELGISHAALYAHFADKAALLDAVSERWLVKMDRELEAICKRSKDPCDKILAWALALNHAKLEKIQNDPELYRAFDLTAVIGKPYVRRHMDNLEGQLIGLVTEAIEKRRLRQANPETMAKILWEATLAFHHPKLVTQHLGEKREPLLRAVVESVLKGLNLRA